MSDPENGAGPADENRPTASGASDDTPPTAKELGVGTTQASAQSPLHTPEGAALIARAEAKKRQPTVIGIAPPATGGQGPADDESTAPSAPPAVPPDRPTTPSAAPSPYTDTVVAMKSPVDGGPVMLGTKSRPVGSTTLVGAAPPGIRSVPPRAGGPAPIVPRRRTPFTGMPAVSNETHKAVAPGTSDEALVPKPVVKVKTVNTPTDIRIPQGGILGSSAPGKVKNAGTLLCELLVKNGSVTEEMVEKALALQEERGGQIGRILVSIGACTEEAIARALLDQLKIRENAGAPSDISIAAREHRDVAGLKVLTRPIRTVVVLLMTDLVSLVLAALLASSVHWVRTYSELQEIDWSSWLVVGPSISLCLLTFLGLELYSPMAKSTPDEIRDITFAASLVHLGASVLATLGDLPIVRWGVFVRAVWWLATLFFVPVIRSFVRGYLSVQPWWGIPVCVLGASKTGRLVVRTLRAQPRSGLKPVMLLDDDPSKHGTLRASFKDEKMDVYSVNMSASQLFTESQRADLAKDIFGDELPASQPLSSDHLPIAPETWQSLSERDIASLKRSGKKEDRSSGEFWTPESHRPPKSVISKDASQFPRGKYAEVDGVPVVGDLSLAPVLADRLKIPYAVLAMPGVESMKLLQIVERIGGKFTHLLIIPDLFGFATMGVPAKSLGGILGVEVRQQLLLPGPRLAKRIMDVALTCFGGIFVLPFLLLIALLIKLDSKGPVFYTQKRLGKDGTYFAAYKFRTMHGDGEARLKAILDADPTLRAEYEIYHKLKKDPRVTRIGRVLRKFSLDEFPQLLNVIKGDMSLVGPRPYIERELTEMDGQEKIILRAPPGMTGMWQVSDRNATSFAQRVQIDVYYVRNWSPWLDVHILAKTFGVVIKGSGV